MSKLVPQSLVLFFISLVVNAQTPPPVPSLFQDLYTQLTNQITSFNTIVGGGWNGQPYPVINSAQLRSASCEQGGLLLGPGYYSGVLNEIQSLQALGINTFTVHIDFPTLDPAFYLNQADYQNYLNFYIQLSNDIHARGLKLIVENSVVFPQPGISTLSAPVFYKTLTWTTYEQSRAQQAALIAQQLHPDYLSVITEPDTESSATLQINVNTVSGATDMLNQMLAAIQATGVTGVSVGAGCGTWQNGFSNFATSFAGTAVQFVDMHIYPINRTYLPNAITIAQIAHAAGKQVGMTETWMYKERDSELGKLTSTVIYGRDPFSFWEPLDQSYLQSIVNFAQYQQLTFISPFWSTYFHVYLDYATYGTMTASQLLSLSGTQSGVAISSGQFTPTGTAYENMFFKPIDTIPPTAPPGPGYTATTTQINLTWLSSSDNVGVAGYNIYRNGTLANTTSGLFFQDLNLTANTAYNYAIEAFDALKNTSPQTLITATTQRNPDTQPPTVPTGLAATGTGVTQISLSWTASTDDVAVTGYKIYRGTAPTTVAIYSSSASNSFLDLNCSPTAAYYYSVAAYDAAGNVSAQSTVISGKSLPDTVPPSVPTNLQTTAVASTSVSLAWSASTDNVKVSNYRIYRGTSPTTLQNIGSTTTLAYTDTKVTTKKTYYYTVAAVDTSKNVSAQSPAILVTTP